MATSRDTLIDFLVEKELINRVQAERLKTWTGGDTGQEVPPEAVLSLVAGGLHKQPIEIQNALAGSVWETPAANITPAQPSVVDRLTDMSEEVRSGFWGNLTENFIEGGNDIGDWMMSVGAAAWSKMTEGPMGDDQDNFRAFTDELRDTIQSAVDDGLIDKKYLGDLDDSERQEWVPQIKALYEEIVDLLPDEYLGDLEQAAGTSTLVTSTAEAETQATAQAEEDERRKQEAAREEIARQRVSWFETGGAARQEEAIDSAGRIVTGIDTGTWLGLMSQTGLLAVNEEGEIFRAETPGWSIGPDNYFDPATGEVYSQGQIESYRDDIIRATLDGIDPRVAGDAAARVQAVIDKGYADARPWTKSMLEKAGITIDNSGSPVDSRTRGGVYLPQEDIEGTIPTLMPDDPWERPLYTYVDGQAEFMWSSMSVEERERWTTEMLRTGAISPEDAEFVDSSDPFASYQVEALKGAMIGSAGYQVDLWTGLRPYGNAMNQQRAAQARANAVASAFSIPASLRYVPGDKTLAQEVKDRFTRVLGREVRDEELQPMARDLLGYYEDSTHQKIALAYAAYEGDNQGLLTGAQLERIEDPGAALSEDIEQTWANEIDLNARRESNSDSFQRILQATMGGQVGLGAQTAAGGIEEIGRLA